MSDYDTKIIPILDDIIEIEATENVITLDDSPVDPDDLSHPTKNNLDLFSEEVTSSLWTTALSTRMTYPTRQKTTWIYFLKRQVISSTNTSDRR